MGATSEIHFARLRVEAEETLLRELGRIDVERDARRARVLEERRLHAERLDELHALVRRAREELAEAQARVPSGLGVPGATGSLMLGLAGCAGVALALAGALASQPGAAEVTRALSGWLGSFQRTVGGSELVRVVATWAALLALIAAVALWRRPTLLPGTRPVWLVGPALALLWAMHWPVGTSAVSALPLVEGALLAGAAMGAWVLLKHELTCLGVDPRWLLALSASAAAVLLFFDPLGTWIVGAAAIGGLSVERTNRAWAGLSVLVELRRRERRHALRGEHYRREAGLYTPATAAQMPASRQGSTRHERLDALRPGGAAGTTTRSFEQQLEDIDLGRERERHAAFVGKAATLKEIDHAQILHGRYHEW